MQPGLLRTARLGVCCRALGAVPAALARPLEHPPGSGHPPPAPTQAASGHELSGSRAPSAGSGPALTVSSVSVLSSALSTLRRSLCPSAPVPSFPRGSRDPSPTGDGDSAPVSTLFFSLSLDPARTETGIWGACAKSPRPCRVSLCQRGPWTLPCQPGEAGGQGDFVQAALDAQLPPGHVGRDPSHPGTDMGCQRVYGPSPHPRDALCAGPCGPSSPADCPPAP